MFISIFYLCCRYNAKEKSMTSDTYHYKKGANQTFSQTSHVVEPSKFPEEEVR